MRRPCHLRPHQPQQRRGQRIRQLPPLLRPDGDAPALPIVSQRGRQRGRGRSGQRH